MVKYFVRCAAEARQFATKIITKLCKMFGGNRRMAFREEPNGLVLDGAHVKFSQANACRRMDGFCFFVPSSGMVYGIAQAAFQTSNNNNIMST